MKAFEAIGAVESVKAVSDTNSPVSGKIIEVNIRESEISHVCDVNVFAPSGESLPILVEEVEKLT